MLVFGERKKVATLRPPSESEPDTKGITDAAKNLFLEDSVECTLTLQEFHQDLEEWIDIGGCFVAGNKQKIKVVVESVSIEVDTCL